MSDALDLEEMERRERLRRLGRAITAWESQCQQVLAREFEKLADEYAASRPISATSGVGETDEAVNGATS